MWPRLRRSGRQSLAGGIGAAVVSVAMLTVQPLSATGSSAADGWVVPGVRVQPVDPDATVRIGGVGEFRGAVDVVRGRGGLGAVNELRLEEYLLGIAEVPASWPIEAQRAQAIAARTYALHVMAGTHPSAFRAIGAHICATQACQVYLGLDGERRRGGAAWRSAVESTQGQVLLYGGRPIRAKYSASNGGHTAAGGAPYLPAAPDPDDAAVSPYARWQSSLTLAELASAVPGDGHLVSVWTAEPGVVLGRHRPDGSVVEQVVPQAHLRDVLNDVLSPRPGLPVPVPSPFFSATSQGEQVVLDGRGYGHGVGMSQYGALGKALRGMTAPGILAAYYGGLTPTALPPEQLPERIRAAVVLGRSELSLTSAAPFRVLAPDGSSLAHAAAGTWRVVPGPDGGVRVLPAAEEAAPPEVTVLGLEPEPAAPGQDVLVRFAIEAPAVVRVRRDGAGAPAVELGLLAGGEHRVTVAAPPVPGGAIIVEADAGGGRVGSAAVNIPTRSSTTQAHRSRGLVGASAPAPSLPTAAVASAAVLVLCAAAGAVWILVRRSPRAPDHG